MSYWSRRQTKEEKDGSQKEPLPEQVNSRFGKVINPGDEVVTFTQAGRSTHVDKGVYRGVMRVHNYSRADSDHEWSRDRSWTYYVVERADGKRTKLHYEQSLCHGSVTVQDLVGHNI